MLTLSPQFWGTLKSDSLKFQDFELWFHPKLATVYLLDYLVPPKGRPIPSDWKSCDIAHMQVELVVNDIEQAVDMLRENGVEVVSSQVVQFRDSSWPYHQGCLVKDPDGHAMLLIAE